MGGEKFINATKRSGFVRIAFAKNMQGLRVLRNLVRSHPGVQLAPTDKAEVEMVLTLAEWGHQNRFNFAGLGTVEDNTLYQYARDIDNVD